MNENCVEGDFRNENCVEGECFTWNMEICFMQILF